MAELRVDSVTKRFGDFVAVDNVNLTIRDQEFMVLLGPSGCGKSTLLRCIAGLETIDDGVVYIDNADVTALQPRRRNISMVFQSYAVFPHLTVFENIAFGLRRQRQSKEKIDKRVHSAAGLLHIEDLLERHPASLSGGQRQRVAVARALAYDAKVLLMDEPLSNLDALLRIEMRAELKHLLAELESTVIYVTHDQVEALSMGDRIAVMNQGRILQVGTPLEIYNQPAERFIGGFIGNPPMNFLSAQRVNGGVRVAGALLPLTPPAAAGDNVNLGIRAENMEVFTQAAEGTIPGSVLVVEPLGSHNLVTVRAADTDLKVTTHADMGFGSNQDVWLRVVPEKVTWIDPGTGAAYD